VEKQDIQRLGETYVRDLLISRGHQILGRNVRRGRFEFDIITKDKELMYLHEVRTTTTWKPIPQQFFPITKLLTLINGQQLYFPNHEIKLHLVSVGPTSQVKSHQSYALSDLLP